ncbi:CarD family transcriptional regulator [Clostridium bornimense]|uniref:CarD family transcriptional regulator n=1 Tax=Clostridium bornimense TaxID=1216932 RepID=UPI001C1164DA|nr:CarD family transcriptional regulator [Clostridium bornimense]MBU5314880.1 CarD family transcriptional regulator [Clostridium bornimense]
MFKIGDYIMYGVTGVCKVTDIIKEKYFNNEEDYYVLEPVYATTETIIKIPVANKKVFMRNIISKEDIDNLIEEMPLEKEVWIDDERERNYKFKSMVRSGDYKQWSTLIKTIFLKREEKKLEGKKITQEDERLFKSAEKLLNEEIATILHILPDEVPKYIQSNIS